MKISTRLLILVTSSLCFFAVTAKAQNPFQKSPENCSADSSPIPVSLTLSGGVSLGAYQGGFLYYTSLVFRENPDLFETKLITGSSAGGMNTLLSILSFCGSESSSPSASALYRAWTGLTAKDLLGPSGDPRALVPRTSFTKFADNIEEEWMKGLPTSCDIVIGVSATRLVPKRLVISESLVLDRQEEKFTIRVRGRGNGKAPLVTNYLTALSNNNQPILELTPGDDKQNFGALRDLLYATSAFPLVFAPQKLRYCTINSSEKRWLHADYPLNCKQDEIEEAEFVDGGILDNKPMGMADRLSRVGLTTNSCRRSAWREIPLPLPSAPSSNDNVLFIYSDINSLAYPTGTGEAASEMNLFSYLGGFFGGTFETMRAKDTVLSFENNPKLAKQIAAPRNYFPRAGDPLYGFFGFFERDFRRYDFYLGMYDARLFFKDQLMRNLYRGPEPLSSRMKLPEEAKSDTAEWNLFRCVIGHLENKPQFKSFCKEGDAKNIEILADVSVEQLRALCERNNTPKEKSACEILRVHPKSQSPIQKKESDFTYNLRLLSEKQFEFKDMGLEPDQAADAGARIKAGALDAFFRLADSQPSGSRTLTRFGGPVLLNSVESLPLARDVSVVLGTALKAQVSFLQPSRIFPAKWRAVGAVQLQNLSGWLGPGEGHVAPGLLAGAERESQLFSNGFLETRFRLMGGYQYHSHRSDDLNSCVSQRSPANECRGFVIQPGASWIVGERLRFDLDLQALPFQRSRVPWQLLPALGFQFYF